MGYVPRRKLDTAEYPAITPARIARANAVTEQFPTVQQQQNALAHTLYCTEMHHYGIPPVEWESVVGDTRERFMKLASTALTWGHA